MPFGTRGSNAQAGINDIVDSGTLVPIHPFARSVTGSEGLAINEMTLYPFLPQRRISFSGFRVNNATAGSFGNRALAYESDPLTGVPTNKIFEGELDPVPILTWYTIPTPITVLQPSILYWLGLWSESTGPSGASYTSENHHFFVSPSVFVDQGIDALRRVLVWTGNVAPDPWGFLLTDADNTASLMPCIFLIET